MVDVSGVYAVMLYLVSFLFKHPTELLNFNQQMPFDIPRIQNKSPGVSDGDILK